MNGWVNKCICPPSSKLTYLLNICARGLHRFLNVTFSKMISPSSAWGTLTARPSFGTQASLLHVPSPRWSLCPSGAWSQDLGVSFFSHRSPPGLAVLPMALASISLLSLHTAADLSPPPSHLGICHSTLLLAPGKAQWLLLQDFFPVLTSPRPALSISPASSLLHPTLFIPFRSNLMSSSLTFVPLACCLFSLEAFSTLLPP